MNTARRLALASYSQAHSVDGTSATKFAKTIPMLTSAGQNRDLLCDASGSASWRKIHTQLQVPARLARPEIIEPDQGELFT